MLNIDDNNDDNDSNNKISIMMYEYIYLTSGWWFGTFFQIGFIEDVSIV